MMKFRIFLTLTLLALLLVSVAPLAAQDDAFPVTIEHKYGDVTLEAEPERIVVLGYTEQDFYFALGVEPIAIRYWYGDETDAIFPWADDAAGDAEPVILNMPYGTLNYEAILALEPDLISAIDAGVTEEEYETLSQIAPTLVESADYVQFGSPWQATTLMIGEALGMSEETETVVADLEAKLEAVREQYPEFEGATIAVAYNSLGSYGYYTGQDSRGRFFTDLGFVVPDELNDIAGDSFFADISEERVDLLDQDLIVWLALQFFEDGSAAARESIETDPLLAQLDAFQDGRVVYVADEFDNALQFSSVLSIEFLLDNLVPELAAALGDGDTAMGDMCEPGFNSVVDATGEGVCLPENPERIVALSEVDIDALLSLGVEPVAITDGRGQNTAPGFLLDALPVDVVSTGRFFQPNLEVVLGAEPDLILFAGFSDPDVLAQLNAIAPVYNAATFAESWQVHIERVGEALGLEDEAATVVADYDARIASIQEQLTEQSGSEFVVVRWAPEGPQIMAPRTISSQILIDLGLMPPVEIPELEDGHAHTPSLSLETLDLIDVDWAFVGTLQSEGEAVEALLDTLDSPLFQALSIVQNERLIVIDGSIWTSVGGAIGANIILDDIEAALLGEAA